MPQRFLRPGITFSERWNAVSFAAQSLYVRLLTIVDDFGRTDGRTAMIAHTFTIWNELHPQEQVRLQQVEDMLQQLAASSLIERYQAEGKYVLQISQWQERIRDGVKEKWPCRKLQQDNGELLPSSSIILVSASSPSSNGHVSAEQIYSAYPKHVAKDEALKAINKRLKGGISGAHLLERTEAFAKTQPKHYKFTPHPATWFNRGSYDDDPATWIVRDETSAASRKNVKAGREYSETTRDLSRITRTFH